MKIKKLIFYIKRTNMDITNFFLLQNIEKEQNGFYVISKFFYP